MLYGSRTMNDATERDDIDFLIREIEHIKFNLNDPSLGSVFWEEAMKDFINRHGGELVAMLRELIKRRAAESQSGGGLHKDTHRIIVEGFSDENPNAALSNALDKASGYFSEQHDVSFTLMGLSHLPHGGHRALLEVHVTPMTLRNKCHPQEQDVELKHIHDSDYRNRKKYDEEHKKHLVFDHFATTVGGSPLEIPDYFLINIKDADLMNFMIEKAFFNAGKKGPAESSPETPEKIMVRVVKPKLELEDDLI